MTIDVAPCLLSASGVQEHFSLSLSTVRRLIKSAGFPRPLQLAPRRVAWRTSEIESWLVDRPRAVGKEAQP